LKVVLAYSGGLDTSIILHWIKETYNAGVIAYTGTSDSLPFGMRCLRSSKGLRQKRISEKRNCESFLFVEKAWPDSPSLYSS
jgi:PP-loop superfamily ATP-utilizing enzyme